MCICTTDNEIYQLKKHITDFFIFEVEHKILAHEESVSYSVSLAISVHYPPHVRNLNLLMADTVGLSLYK